LRPCLYGYLTAARKPTALAGFEHGVIHEARRRDYRLLGHEGGRARKLNDTRAHLAMTMLKAPNNRVADICDALGMSRATLVGIFSSCFLPS